MHVDFSLAEVAAVIAPTVVSATREVQRRTDQSATIDVLEGAAIREVRAAHPSGIMQRLPGVHATQLSGEGLSMAIRQPITTKPMYLYLEDGVPTRSTGFFNHNALYEVNLPQAGGLEVLKGPGTAHLRQRRDRRRGERAHARRAGDADARCDGRRRSVRLRAHACDGRLHEGRRTACAQI